MMFKLILFLSSFICCTYIIVVLYCYYISRHWWKDVCDYIYILSSFLINARLITYQYIMHAMQQIAELFALK